METVRVCVDAMGGDEEPSVVLQGIAAALAADGALEVLVAGPADIVEPFCREHDRAEALVAPEVITMEDDPIKAVMTKRKSSIVLACRAIKKGNAQGFFSAGSTGAVTAAATAYVTPFRFEEDGERRPVRPCITTAVPNSLGTLTVFADMGANPDVEPDDIVRFAQMASAYARVVCGIARPRVGLLSNGTEEHKGSRFTQQCYPLMAERVPGFAGNAEGTDLLAGTFDVIVADGFTGNVALKSIEGTGKFVIKRLKAAMGESLGNKIGMALLAKSLKSLAAEMSGDEYGGAILLGLRAPVVKGHGATSAQAVRMGTLAAARAARAGLSQKIAEACEISR